MTIPFVVLVVQIWCVFASQDPTDHNHRLFKEFMTKYNKSFNNGTEYQKKFATFKENLDYSRQFNSMRNETSDAYYGINQFSDLTKDEFKALYLSSYAINNTSSRVQPLFSIKSQAKSRAKIPKKIDWRSLHAVTSVKNQKLCGGCWAFSSVAAIEGVVAIKTGVLKSEVIDCSYGFMDILSGCSGGDQCTALKWLQQYEFGLVNESKYPTTDIRGKCKQNKLTFAGVRVKQYHCLSLVQNESYVRQLLAQFGPVAVSVDATSWHNYQGGVIQYHCGSRVNNHAVTIVGYDASGPVPHYIVKNSWGTDFGDHGYMYIAMGNNVCGIANRVALVVVE